MLTANALTVRYGDTPAVDSVSLSIGEGEWWMLTGPNGAGKSTLLNALSQGVRYEGDVLIDGRNAKRFRPAALAREIGVLSQLHEVGYAFSVEEVVALGRYAYAGGMFRQGGDGDAETVDRAIHDAGLDQLRRRSMLSLSGGERQRAFLAQIFAQNPRVMLLDEPVNHLDLMYQKQLFALIGDWLKTPGRAVLSVVHDLSLARRFGTHCALMCEGRCVAQGASEDVLSRERLEAVYGMDVYGWMRDMLSQWHIE